MKPIRLLATNMQVQPLRLELFNNAGLWNSHRDRTNRYAHSGVSDIWVRCAEDPEAMRGEAPVDAVWYPAFSRLLSLEDLIWPVMHYVRGERLGGVLITKIPPGGEVHPHIDDSWHARYYDKFAVQVVGNEKQAFCFDEASLVTKTGDLFTFDNSRTHWVRNDSDEDRITLILCIKTHFTERRVRS